MRLTAAIVTTTAAVALTVGNFAGASDAKAQPSGASQGADVCEVGATGKMRCWDSAKATTAVQQAELAKKRKCAKVWVCLYDGKNFEGRMLRFHSDYRIDLNDYNFGKKTSSWKNGKSRAAYLDGVGPKLKLKPNSSDGSMGRFNNWATTLHP